MKRLVSILAVVTALAAVGCKKKGNTDSTGSAGSGSDMAGSSMAGSDMAGSSMAGSGSATMAGSGAGSATMAGSGSATMAGSGSATMAGSGSAAEPPRPATITDDMLAKGDALMDQLLALGKGLTDANGDCKKATAAIKAATPAITAAVKEVEKFKPVTDKDPAAKGWLEQHYDAKMRPMGDPFLATAGACKDDKDFVKAMTSLQLFKKKANSPPSDVPAKVEPAEPAPTK